MSEWHNYAVVIMANDKFIDFLIPFLESFRDSNPTLRLILIPFDEEIGAIRALAASYNFQIYEGSCREIDSLADDMFGAHLYLRKRMRKLVAFDLDVDEFLYIDADVIVEQSLDLFFGWIQPGTIDLVYLSGANAVYKADLDRLLNVSKLNCFGTGCFVSSGRVTRVSEICRVMRVQREAFLQVRVEHLYDQPLLNYFFHATDRIVCRAGALGIKFVYCSINNSKMELTSQGRPVLAGNREITIIHWAGPQKLKTSRPFGSIMEPYLQRARKRLRSIPELADWIQSKS